MAPSTDHLGVYYKDGTAEAFVRPPTTEQVQLYRQLHDYELWPTTFNARPAEVFRMDPFDHTLMDQRIQEMWFGQIKLEGAGLPFSYLTQAWVWLTRSNGYLTNGQGPDYRRDYILNTRMDQPLPGMFPLGLGGNVYTGVEEMHRGEKSLRVDTLMPRNPDGSTFPFPGDLSHKVYPWLIHYCTVTTTKRISEGPYAGNYVVNPFSNAYWVGRNAPSPLMASEPVWIGLDMVRKLPLGSPAPSPYMPPRS